MKITKNASLKSYNTFGIDAKANMLISINHEDELIDFLEKISDTSEIKILGGGSNILFINEQIEQAIIKNDIKGIAIVSEDDGDVLIQVGAGENWHDLVTWAVENNLGGIENLALIPGTVGAAPIQNIGAYGVEIKDVFEALTAIHLQQKKEYVFTKDECEMDYRDSIFKNEWKGQLCITRVYLRLKRPPHQINSSYKDISNALEKHKIDLATIKDIYKIVVDIRSHKLPDPNDIGNAGSFFKNPIINKEHFEAFISKFPNAPHWKINDNEFKIPAAWLIDQCGYKGKRKGNTGCYKNQALVLVNYGNAKGKEIWSLSKEIQKTVFEKYQIKLIPEVNFWE